MLRPFANFASLHFIVKALHKKTAGYKGVIHHKASPMAEKVKRLTPKPEVLRELFLKSGNVCAFPGCLHPIVDTNGVYVAQLCHIEAANEGGQRFNAIQTNEQRRQFENLLLMCHRHHKETDDVSRFSVEKLKEIKRQHEAKFEKVLDSLANDVYDVALAYEPTPPESVEVFVKEGWIEPEEKPVFMEEMNELIRLLNQLSPTTRKIFLLVVNRVDLSSRDFPLNEFQYVVSMESQEAYNHIAILERYGLLFDNEDTDFYERKITVSSVTIESPHPVVLILREYCEKYKGDLSSMLVDLNFEALKSNV